MRSCVRTCISSPRPIVSFKILVGRVEQVIGYKGSCLLHIGCTLGLMSEMYGVCTVQWSRGGRRGVAKNEVRRSIFRSIFGPVPVAAWTEVGGVVVCRCGSNVDGDEIECGLSLMFLGFCLGLLWVGMGGWVYGYMGCGS